MIFPVVGEQCPDHPGVLVGERHGGHVLVPAPKECIHLGPRRRGLPTMPVDHRARPMDEQRAQIGVSPFTDAEQLDSSTGGMLSRGQSEQVANCRPFLKAVASPVAATRALAVRGPCLGWR